MKTYQNEAVTAESVRHIYTSDLGGGHGRRARKPRHAAPWNDNALAIGGIVAAVIVTFLFILGLAVSL